MLTDIIAAIWQKPAVLAWITAWGFCPTKVSVVTSGGIEGVFLLHQDVEAEEGREAVHRTKQISVEKCLAFLAPPRKIEIVVPALWEILREYDLDRETHVVLAQAIAKQIKMPKGVAWVLTPTGFLSYCTGVELKHITTVKIKPLDKDTVAVKIPFTAEVHQCLFDHLVSFL